MSNYAELEQVLKAVRDCGRYGEILSNAIGGPAVFTNFGWLRSMADFEQWPFRPAGERDWAEDFSHENGHYQNQCSICEHFFHGHKGRRVCKSCTAGIVRSPVFYSKEYEDLTLEEATEVSRHGWRKVSGRTEMVLVRQIARLLAAQSVSQIALIKIANELRAYIPDADACKKNHIHKVWARGIEAAVKGDVAAQSGINLVKPQAT